MKITFLLIFLPFFSSCDDKRHALKGEFLANLVSKIAFIAKMQCFWAVHHKGDFRRCAFILHGVVDFHGFAKITWQGVRLCRGVYKLIKPCGRDFLNEIRKNLQNFIKQHAHALAAFCAYADDGRVG